jgi:outer membrane protein OmpA-like peptidoglycan-associated protein
MTRLAVPILILLLMLLAGAGWLLIVHLNPPEVAGKPPTETAPSISGQQAPASAGKTPLRAEAPKTDNQNASFDVARIDPKGTSVFAGRAAPGSTVTILGDGQAIGTAEADANGEWTFATEHRFANADPKLALAVKSAAQVKAEKAAKAKVASSLETREAAKETLKRRSAKAVTSDLLKSFEGIVAAARTEAQNEKKKGEAPKEKKEEKKGAEQQVVAEPPPAVALNEPKPSTSNAPATRLAATTPEAPAEVEHKSIPVPITFVFDEATFTDEGKKAAALLLEYLQLKHFPSVTLTGHADERGSEELNMNLSRERLDTVARFLREGGYEGKLNLIPKGESEPFTGVVRSQYTQEELWQFDRRVELIITP